MEEEEVVYLKIFDEKKGNVVFEGKVSTDVEPQDLLWLRCFRERDFLGFWTKATNEQVKSFRGLQNNVELVARRFGLTSLSGVVYIDADDGVVRKSKSVPLCETVLMLMRGLSHEECEKAFKCETLEELEMYRCQLRQIPPEIGKMKKLKNLRILRVRDLKSIPEEIGELSNLEEVWLGACDVESLPKRLKELKMLRKITLVGLSKLQMNADDLVVFSKLRQLTIKDCRNVLTAPFERAFWEMIKTTTSLRFLELYWYAHNQEMVAAAMEENGSIIDGGKGSESYAHFFKRNKENHERAMECVVHLLAIRRWRNALNNVPKEMVKMIAMMLWTTRCDVGAWARQH